MIEMVSRSGPPEAQLCPAFVCDACRQQVTERGNILYAEQVRDRTNQTTPLFVAHKGQCDRALKHHMQKVYPSADGWLHLWRELATFTDQLAHNTAHPFAEDPDGTYRIAGVRFPSQ